MSRDQDWERFEKIVSILERQVHRGAIVKRNQYLPVLGSPSGRTRQCDVVIEDGKLPRITVSIVEVQKRNSKPTINDFNGWVEKLKEVGAQHLICVSARGFPESINEKAKQLGPTIRLITLKSACNEDWPLPKTSLHHKLKSVRYDRLNGLQMEGEHLFRIDPSEDSKRSPDPHRKIFRSLDGQLISPTDVLDWHFFSSPSNLDALPINTPITVLVDFSWEWNQGLQYQDFGGTWVFLKRLVLSISLFITESEMDWEASAYRQIDWGEVGWALRGHGQVDGRSLELIAPLICTAPGEYHLRSPIVLGDQDAFFAVGGRGFKAVRYEDSM